MAYHPLEISLTTPKKVQHFIRRYVDMLFEDVHCMMRLPIPAQELRAGCNFAAATFLLDLISGISRSLYSGPGGSGVRFKAVLEKYYPWDMEPVGGFDAKTGSKVLYDIFRNPLVHALGLSGERMAIGKSALPEYLLVSLERSVVRPKDGPAEATIRAYPAEKRKDLLVEGLYWGVRHMVYRLRNDPGLMTEVGKKVP
jgi:hypothetical protein